MRISNILAGAGIAATLALAPTAQAQPGARHVSHFVSPDRGHDADAITTPPPASRDEHRPPRPFREAVWTGGYWNWNGNAYVWVDGTWMRPIPGRRWSPWRWTQQSDGHWQLIPGGWVPSHEGAL